MHLVPPSFVLILQTDDTPMSSRFRFESFDGTTEDDMTRDREGGLNCESQSWPTAQKLTIHSALYNQCHPLLLPLLRLLPAQRSL